MYTNSFQFNFRNTKVLSLKLEIYLEKSNLLEKQFILNECIINNFN